LLVSREPMIWTATATHPTFTDHQFELGSSGHNAVCARVNMVPGKEKNTSVLPKIFEDLKPSRNCTIAIAAPQQRIEKTNSQKLIEKKRKDRQIYMNEYMNEKGRPIIPSKLSQYLVTGDSPLSNFDQNVQLVLTCLSVLIQMCLIGVAGMTLPVALLHKFGHYRSGMFPVRIRTRVRRTRSRTASGTCTSMNVFWKIFSVVREFGRVGHKKNNKKFWQRGNGSGRKLSQSLGSAKTSDRRGRRPPSAVRRSCTSVFALVFFALAIMDKIGSGVQAVFAPADSAALKAAVGTCLSETPDGSCPTFSFSNGVIGAWDVSAVTTMESSKCTCILSRSLWPRRLPLLWCGVETTRGSSVTKVSHVLFFVCLWFDTGPFVVVCVWWVWSFFSLLHPSLFLQCLNPHLRSIRTCRNGLRVP
jgi:hypothetical protein